MIKKLFAEMIGTALLTLFTSGTAITIQASVFNTSGFLISTFSAFLIMYVLQELLREISGAHLNPVISFSMLLERKISFLEFIGYFLAQGIGAVIGAFLISSIAEDNVSLTGGVVSLIDGNIAKTVIFETLVIGCFVWSILTAQVKNNASILIATSFGVCNLFLMMVDGGNLNPLKTLSINLLSMIKQNDFTDISNLLFLCVIPFLGSILGWLLYSLFLPNEKDEYKPEKKAQKEQKGKNNEIFTDENGETWIISDDCSEKVEN